jgi:hypothetical protein
MPDFLSRRYTSTALRFNLRERLPMQNVTKSMLLQLILEYLNFHHVFYYCTHNMQSYNFLFIKKSLRQILTFLSNRFFISSDAPTLKTAASTITQHLHILRATIRTHPRFRFVFVWFHNRIGLNFLSTYCCKSI